MLIDFSSEKPIYLQLAEAIEPNRIYGLLGRNGAGKITLLNLMTNRIFPTEGDVLIVPILVIALFQYTDWISGGLEGRTVTDFLNKAMGFAYNNNVYVGALSLFIGAAAIALICFLPLRNAIAKD